MGTKSCRGSSRLAAGAVLLGLATALSLAVPASAVAASADHRDHNCGSWNWDGNTVGGAHGDFGRGRGSRVRHHRLDDRRDDNRDRRDDNRDQRDDESRNHNCDNWNREGNHVSVPPGLFGDS